MGSHRLETVLVNKRFGEWVDVRDFVRPNDPMVAAVTDVRRSWTLEDLWQWVLANIRYPHGDLEQLDTHVLIAYRDPRTGQALLRYETKDFWNFPAETLRDGVGDCEDGATLLASIIRRALPQQSVFVAAGWFVPPTMPNRAFGHVWATVPLPGGKFRVLDTTIRRLPDRIVVEGPPGPYRPILRWNDLGVQVLDPALRLPERTWEPGKDEALRSWYALVPEGTGLRVR